MPRVGPGPAAGPILRITPLVKKSSAREELVMVTHQDGGTNLHRMLDEDALLEKVNVVYNKKKILKKERKSKKVKPKSGVKMKNLRKYEEI